MQITLNQKEIETAIISYVGSQGIAITGKHVDVALVAGRGPNGMSASIDISNDSNAPTPRVVIEDSDTDSKPKTKRGRKKAKSVEDEPDVPDTDKVNDPPPFTEEVTDKEVPPAFEEDDDDDDLPLFGN